MDRKQPTIAVFCTPETGHFQALRPLISHLVRRGMSVHVFTHRAFEQHVEAAGGVFVDLFGAYSLDEADSESKPIPCRYVSFAGAYAERVMEDLRTLRPDFVLYETFSVIAPLAARALGLPSVNVCVNHNPHPQRTLLKLRGDARVAISPRCHRAAETLRDRYGWKDASPFAYVTALSPLLNIYAEPPEFLDGEDHAAYQPLAFFGCLPDDLPIAPPQPGTGYFYQASAGDLKVYVSFGTVVWRYYAGEALAALRSIVDGCYELGGVQVVISLGEASIPPDSLASLARPGVQVLPLVEQNQILNEANLFVTHHGINSTHEAIYHRVPMISYPFFSDQPALAAKCQQFGLAIPLTQDLRGAISPKQVQAAISRYLSTKAAMQTSLEIAHSWERRTMDQRAEVIERLVDLIQPR